MVTLETEIIGFLLFYKPVALKRCEWAVIQLFFGWFRQDACGADQPFANGNPDAR
jgi:hypothetical protein